MKYRSLAISGIAALCLTASCVDDNYDLSNLDTTVRVEVKDLNVPINVDEIVIGSVLDLNEDDPIKIVDGQYCLVEEGDFHSSPVKIDAFTLQAGSKNTIDMTLPFVLIPGLEFEGTFDIDTKPSDFSFETNEVPKEIIEFDSIDGSLNLNIEFRINGLEDVADSFTLRGVVLQMPKGLKLVDDKYDYNPETGLMSLDDMNIFGNGLDLNIQARGIDLDQMGINYDYDKQSAKVDGEFYVKEGQIYIHTTDLKDPDKAWTVTEIDLHIAYGLTNIDITAFSGVMEYEFDGVDISDISLDDIPDMLSQDGTDLHIANPQVYVKINNPLQDFGVTAQTGITITSYDNHGNPGNTASLDNEFFSIGTQNTSGIYSFCLSPSRPEHIYEGFDGAEHVPFTALSHILRGNRIPRTIGVELSKPGIPRQRLKDLGLNNDFDAIDGTYAFVAPIALLEGSRVRYTDVENGWHSDDLGKMTITDLTLHTDISTDLPIELNLTVEPLDVRGNKIDVTVDPIHLDALADKQSFEIHIRGKINDLDGIRFTAEAIDKAVVALSPSMKIKLENITVSASGYYDDEL